ncbi:MAG: RNA 2',3'-cyclic phosphodiesterase [Terracidiphilus sp.]
MRLFLGIPLAPGVIGTLETLVKSLRSEGGNLRWGSSESWHITLQFLGETSEEKARCVADRLRDVRSPAVPVQLDGTGFFERAGVFFAGVSVSPEMLGLEKLVLAATAHCGVAAENRPFRPHVTLARIKSDHRMNALRHLKQRVSRDVTFPAFLATEFLLYEAFLGAGGSRYEVRDRFPLGDC